MTERLAQAIENATVEGAAYAEEDTYGGGVEAMRSVAAMIVRAAEAAPHRNTWGQGIDDPKATGKAIAAAAIEAGRKAAEAAPLDVERLAAALTRMCPMDSHDWPEDAGDHEQQAQDIAREYAALRSPDTETARSCCDDLKPHYHGTRWVPLRPDTETAGEAG